MPKIDGNYGIILEECRGSNHEINYRNYDPLRPLLAINASGKICRFARIRTNNEPSRNLRQENSMTFSQNWIRSAIYRVDQFSESNRGKSRFLITGK